MRTSTHVRLIVAAALAVTWALNAGVGVMAAQSGQRPTVLFLCPKGAAKSVLASAYFQKVARERGLNVRVESAGTEPDATVNQAVARHLTAQGIDVPVRRPRKVDGAELERADVVISIGCDLSGLPAPRGELRNWDVPALSEDFDRADENIRRRVLDLVEELLHKTAGR